MTAKKRGTPKMTKPPAPEPPEVSHTIIDKIVLLTIAGLRHQAIVDACGEKLLIPPDQIEGAMAAARRLVTRAAEFDRDEVLGEAITRLDDVYQRGLRVQDIKTALAAQREKNRLLLSMVAPDPEAPAETDVESGEKAPGARSTNIESDELADIVHAIETSIEPLGLTPADDVNDTDAELITKAAQEIVRLRRALKRKPKTQQPTANKKRPTPKGTKKAKPKPKKRKTT